VAYHLDFSDQANKDIDFHKKSGNDTLLKKLLVLLDELTEHPATGTGKPEQLKHNLAGYWSRRISHEHRLVYKIINKDTVQVFSVKGHY